MDALVRLRVFTAVVLASFACAGGLRAGQPSPENLAREESAEIEALVKNILKYSGMNGGVELNFRLKAVPDMENAVAYIERGKRYIGYDPKFLKAISTSKQTDWARLGVLAHEVGHHVYGHTLDEKGSSIPHELESDYYAGFILGLMGADGEQAKAFLDNKYISEGGFTHPRKKVRFEKVAEGWQTASTILVRRDPKPSACPVIDLACPFVRRSECKIKLNGQVLVGKADVRWGHEGAVWGSYVKDGTMIRFTGKCEANGNIRLDHYQGCESLGTIVVRQIDESENDANAWMGTYTRPDGNSAGVIQIQAVGELANMAENNQNLARASWVLRDYKNAVEFARKRIEILEKDPDLQASLAASYNSLSWYLLFAKDYKGAKVASEQSMALQKDRVFHCGNLAHAYLFSGEFTEAEKIYTTYKGRAVEGQTWEYWIADDFRKFREAGLEQPDMRKIEKRLGIEEGVPQ